MRAKTDRLVKELTEELFIVEGVITGLLTRETLQNINLKYSSTASGIAMGSVLLDEIGSASIANFAASDEGIDVSEFAIELRDQEGVLHYFKGCFPEVIFQEGDQVQVIAQPFKTEYAYVNAIIDIEKQYIWTSQQVVNGRLCYRLALMRISAFVSIFVLIFMFTMAFFADGMDMMTSLEGLLLMICLFILALFGGWRVGASFDEQSAELEAILRKIGFYKPTMMNLGHYSVYDVNHKNKVDQDQSTERWMHYTYRIDLAQKEDKEKYGNKK